MGARVNSLSSNRLYNHFPGGQCLRALAVVLVSFYFSPVAFSMPPADSSSAEQTSLPLGAQVDKLTLSVGFPTWRALDERHLLLSQKSSGDFLVTLAHTCVMLPTATTLGVSASNQTVYAGFDYITADGEQCAIQSISRLTAKEVEAITTTATQV